MKTEETEQLLSTVETSGELSPAGRERKRWPADVEGRGILVAGRFGMRFHRSSPR